MVEDRITNEQAKELVFEFYNEIEKGISEIQLFRETYQIKFDIKSGKDGEILYSGQIKGKIRFGGNSRRQGHRITPYSHRAFALGPA
ncbi:hypothetical protein D3C85_1568030 [compost metagenome]